MVKNKKSPNHVRFETSGPIQSSSDTEEIELDDISPNASQRKFVLGVTRERENSGDFLGRDEPFPQPGIALEFLTMKKSHFVMFSDVFSLLRIY